MTYTPIIFPELIKSKWVEVDLGACARRDFPDTYRPNPLLDGVFCDKWVKEIAHTAGADYSWGGYGEDRKHLWRGYYEGAECVTHMGIDYNVPAGTAVSVPRACKVVHRSTDSDMENGWGGRLIVEFLESWKGAPYLLLGHLAHEDLPDVGKEFAEGEIIAHTGIIEQNGGWFPHIHVQCCSAAYFNLYAKIGELENLDGYYLQKGSIEEIAPNPMLLVGTTATALPALSRHLSAKTCIPEPGQK